MGLQLVELIMEFEDEFGISIPDDVAERLQTIEQTVEYIVGILGRRHCPTLGLCPSARRFYELRRGLLETFNIPCVRYVPRPRSDR